VIRRLLHKLAFVLPGGTTLRPWLHRYRGAHIGRNVFIAQLVYIDELHPDTSPSATTARSGCARRS
jgi:hypothetical protein